MQTVRVYITIIQSTSLLYRRKKERKKERKKSNQKKERKKERIVLYIQKKEIYKERKERERKKRREISNKFPGVPVMAQQKRI